MLGTGRVADRGFEFIEWCLRAGFQLRIEVLPGATTPPDWETALVAAAGRPLPGMFPGRRGPPGPSYSDCSGVVGQPPPDLGQLLSGWRTTAVPGAVAIVLGARPGDLRSALDAGCPADGRSDFRPAPGHQGGPSSPTPGIGLHGEPLLAAITDFLRPPTPELIEAVLDRGWWLESPGAEADIGPCFERLMADLVKRFSRQAALADWVVTLRSSIPADLAEVAPFHRELRHRWLRALTGSGFAVEVGCQDESDGSGDTAVADAPEVSVAYPPPADLTVATAGQGHARAGLDALAANALRTAGPGPAAIRRLVIETFGGPYLLSSVCQADGGDPDAGCDAWISNREPGRRRDTPDAGSVDRTDGQGESGSADGLATDGVSAPSAVPRGIPGAIDPAGSPGLPARRDDAIDAPRFGWAVASPPGLLPGVAMTAELRVQHLPLAAPTAVGERLLAGGIWVVRPGTAGDLVVGMPGEGWRVLPHLTTRPALTRLAELLAITIAPPPDP